MQAFTQLTAVAAPLFRANVDTDIIIPSREIRGVGKQGLAEGLFAGWRYREIGGREPDPDFVLNRPEFREAKILLTGENFGCGSSREHAVWALAEYGIRAIIAPSFAPIFENNCVRNGVLPARLPSAAIESLIAGLEAGRTGRELTVDLEACEVRGADGSIHAFSIDEEARQMLLVGADAIDLTLRHRDEIEAFLARDRQLRPWVYLQGERDERP
ncbi:MAG: 3-isopropylmalate dehydratase small subunit [Steroidobacteraceae bacterium]